MKLIITMPNGQKKTKETDDKADIEMMLNRGWKEVAGKSKPTPKKKSKKK